MVIRNLRRGNECAASRVAAGETLQQVVRGEKIYMPRASADVHKTTAFLAIPPESGYLFRTMSTQSSAAPVEAPIASPAPFSLYVHIPYCRTKCLYCDFNSYATRATPWEEYLEALTAELEAYRHHPFTGRPLRTLFFGGGTPSLFPPVFYERLLPRIFAQFPPEAGLELTLECNPGTVTLEKLCGFRAAGVNRLSFGVQSLDPAHLTTLTRIHGPQEAIDAVYLARDAGFDDVSIDLMFGIPGQTIEGWEDELARALALPLSHISVYNLTPEEGTALVKLLERGRMFLPDEEVLVTMYRRTRAILRAHGFEPYEISNFAKDRPCRHNLQYWTGGDYLGVGAGAHAFSAEGHLPPGAERLPEAAAQRPAREDLVSGPALSSSIPAAGRPGEFSSPDSGGCRWSTLRGVREYLDACGSGRPPLATVERLTLREAAAETLLTRGRLMAGIDLGAFERRFGVKARAAVVDRAAPFVRRGLMRLESAHLAPTDEGVLIVNSLIEALSLAVDEALEAETRRTARSARGPKRLITV
jgi:oxygen-independent coproporphyrinogen-3 oxidase